MTERDSRILNAFRLHGYNASYYYADDTGGDWQLGQAEEEKALEIYDLHPELQTEFHRAARDFLWSLDISLRDREARRAVQ